MTKDKLIDKFFAQTLNDEEQILFDELIVNDKSFLEELNFLKNLKRVAEVEDDNTAKAMVAEFEAEYQSKPSRFNFKPLLVAASIALLIGITYFSTPSQIDTEALFNENFEPYRNVVHPIVRSNDQQDLETQAFNYYEKGEYQKALQLFEQLYNKTKTPHYLFYKANALLKLNRPKDAIVELNAHLKTKDTLTEKTHWYLAMAYLKLDDKASAKKNLEQVVLQNTYNVKKAKHLLNTLK
ncbi:hypothetical protein MHTCC0001_30560 [Flavobacteriaceae bacterium MHTCC 0001]